MDDVFADSRNRLPLVTRDELNEVGRKLYDATVGDGRMIAGLAGPAGLMMRAPQLAVLSSALFRFLRDEAGLDRRLAELAILASARETDQDFEWHAHEAAARDAGLEPEIIEVVRVRGPLTGLGEREHTLVALAREAIGEHRVRAATFAAGLRLFGAEALVSYVTLMGHYASIGYLLHVFGQQLPDGATVNLPAPP
jgi:4-carboxymuconolactone decarboxylase